MSSFADALRALMGQAQPRPTPPPPQPSPFQQRLNQGDPRQGNIFLPLQSAETMGPLPPAPPTDYTPLPTQAGALFDNRPKIGPANQFNTKPMPQTGAEPFGQRIQNVEDLVKMVGGMTPTPRNQPEVMMGGDPEKGPLEGLYSRLTRQFEAVPAKQLHPNKIASMFQQVPEEAQFTGASKFAQGNTPVPTAQVLEHLRENPIQLGEKVLSDARVRIPEGPLHKLEPGSYVGENEQYQFPKSPGAIDQHQGLFIEQNPHGTGHDLFGDVGGVFRSDITNRRKDDLLDIAHRERPNLDLPSSHPVEYSPYTLPGSVKGTNQERVISWEGPFGQHPQKFREGVPLPAESTDPHFQSHAFNTPNTQVWSRSNVHETPNGPFKFLEEIQSDWHQKGKDKGYLTPDIQRQFAERGKLTAEDAKTFYNVPEERWAKITQAEREAYYNQMWQDMVKRNGGVPDTPFKSSWADLALKRELHDAASKDLSGISWTPGRVQNQRWDLGQVADVLRIRPLDTHTGFLTGEGPNGPIRFIYDPQKPLEDFVGKGMAEHLRAHPHTDVQVKGLEVGGAGMRQFYDQEVPRKLEKLVGPLGGGKVEPVGFLPSTKEPHQPLFHNGSMEFPFRPGELDSARAAGQTLLQGLRLTPELKRAILSKGFPLLSAAPFAASLGALQDAAKPLDTTKPPR